MPATYSKKRLEDDDDGERDRKKHAGGPLKRSGQQADEFDEYLGSSLEQLSPTQLPTTRDVVRRFRALRIQQPLRRSEPVGLHRPALLAAVQPAGRQRTLAAAPPQPVVWRRRAHQDGEGGDAAGRREWPQRSGASRTSPSTPMQLVTAVFGVALWWWPAPTAPEPPPCWRRSWRGCECVEHCPEWGNEIFVSVPVLNQRAKPGTGDVLKGASRQEWWEPCRACRARSLLRLADVIPTQVNPAVQICCDSCPIIVCLFWFIANYCRGHCDWTGSGTETVNKNGNICNYCVINCQLDDEALILDKFVRGKVCSARQELSNKLYSKSVRWNQFFDPIGMGGHDLWRGGGGDENSKEGDQIYTGFS